MVFSSVPVYLDPPNWHHQQQNQLQTNGSSDDSGHQLLPPLPPPTQATQSTNLGPVRAGPMADRAQIARMQQQQPPDQAGLKCPRCESTNTKFCYFNNYSLSQPRHFCKTCRRYWTRGGALRNVPVGGGCRRNHKKSSKRSRSKSPAATPTIITEKHALQQVQPSVATCHELIGRFPQLPSNRSFVNSLQNMSRYGAVGGNIGHVEHVMGFQDQWRLQQQFPNLLSGFDSTVSSSSSYPFHSEGVEAGVGMVGVGDIIGANSSSRVKLEGINGGMNLLRSPLSISENSNQQFYSWTHDLSGLASSSSAAHLL